MLDMSIRKAADLDGCCLMSRLGGWPPHFAVGAIRYAVYCLNCSYRARVC